MFAAQLELQEWPERRVRCKLKGWGCRPLAEVRALYWRRQHQWRPASCATRRQQRPTNPCTILKDKVHRTAGLPQASPTAIWKRFQPELPQLARYRQLQHAFITRTSAGSRCSGCAGSGSQVPGRVSSHVRTYAPLTALPKQTNNHRERGVPCRGGSRRRCLDRRQRVRLRGAGRARECFRQLCWDLGREPAGSGSVPVVWAASSRARSTAAACGRLLWLLFMITGG